MVGLIQRILFDMIQATAGEEAVIKVKKAAGVDTDKAFHINEVYSDEEWRKLLAATLDVLKATPEQAYTLYADFFAKDALKRFPIWFKMCKNSYEFLQIQTTIHNTFATGVADPDSRRGIVDKFNIEKFPNKIITHYHSPNKLCGLYKALAAWIIQHYNDTAEIIEHQCMHQGAKECEIHVEWSKLTT